MSTGLHRLWPYHTALNGVLVMVLCLNCWTLLCLLIIPVTDVESCEYILYDGLMVLCI